MDTTTIADTESTLVHIATLSLHLEKISTAFRELQHGESPRETLPDYLSSLPERIECLSSDLKERVSLCSDLRKQLHSPNDQKRFVEQLETHEESAEKTLSALVEAKLVVLRTAVVLETLFKVTSYRDLLGKVADGNRRKTMGQALTKSAVTMGKVLQAQEELKGALCLFETGSLREHLLLDERAEELSAIAVEPVSEDSEATEPAGAPEESAPDLKAEGQCDTHESSADPTVPSPASATESSSPQPESCVAVCPSAPGEEKLAENPLSAREFKRLRAALNRWSQWKPLAPSRLGNSVGILEVQDAEAFRVCIGQSRTHGEKQDKQRLHEFPEQIPDGIAALTNLRGDELWNERFTIENSRDHDPTKEAPSPFKPCLEKLSESLSDEFIERRVLPLLRRQRKEATSSRLSRDVRLQIESIKLRKITCGFKDPTLPKSACQFEVWLCGSDEELTVRRLPRIWNAKATCILAGLAFTGMVLGCAVALAVV